MLLLYIIFIVYILAVNFYAILLLKSQRDEYGENESKMNSGDGVTVIPENKLSEATAALAVLGYSQGEINLALKGIDLDGQSLEQIIKQALKKMMKG